MCWSRSTVDTLSHLMFGVEGHCPLIAGIDTSVISTFKFTAGLRYDRPRNTQDSLESRNSHPVKRVINTWKAKSMRLESDNLISPAHPVWEGILLLFAAMCLGETARAFPNRIMHLSRVNQHRPPVVEPGRRRSPLCEPQLQQSLQQMEHCPDSTQQLNHHRASQPFAPMPCWQC